MDEAFSVIVGGVIFFITVTEDCLVQPNGLVIFKVYVPALFTTGVNVFAPETMIISTSASSASSEILKEVFLISTAR